MRLLLIVISDATRQEWAQSVAAACGVADPKIFWGSPVQAAAKLAEHQITPSHLVLDIGARGSDVLDEIDQLAQHCEAGTRVVAVGDTNDIQLYRSLIARGVMEYLPMPADAAEIARILTTPVAAAPPPPVAPVPIPVAPAPAPAAPSSAARHVITFMSAGSGDGASTAALNTAYALSQQFNGATVLVDMDYQFGMVAKHLDLQNQYGIRDLFDHPERGVDATLIKRMVASYGKLDVITAPAELRYLPNVTPDAIRGLVDTLSQSYTNVILDLPHVWLPWMETACKESTQLVLVSQLWLKSVSHAARMMRVFRDINIPMERIVTVINRSGAKFKEAIEPKDFERVCGTEIDFTLANDIKTISAAEAAARSVFEMDESQLARDINRLARGLVGLTTTNHGAVKGGGGLLAGLRKKRDS